MSGKILPSVVWVHGIAVPDGVWMGGSWHRILCTCHRDAEGVYDDGPDEKCPYHGRSPFMVCDTCNYGGHTCPGCGDDTTHEKPVCDGCLADLHEERRTEAEGEVARLLVAAIEANPDRFTEHDLTDHLDVTLANGWLVRVTFEAVRP